VAFGLLLNVFNGLADLYCGPVRQVEFLVLLYLPTAVMSLATVGIFVKSLALVHDCHADSTILDRIEGYYAEALRGQVPGLDHALACPHAREGKTWHEETFALEAIIALCGSALAALFALEVSWAVHAASTHIPLRRMLAAPGPSCCCTCLVRRPLSSA
jgi:hypothetical protein